MAAPRPGKRRATVTTRQPEVRLHFAVVGGSISGLATAYALSLVGHKVTVLEQTDGNITNSTGVTCPPNMTKVLKDWGLQPWVDQKGISCRDFRFLSAQSGDEISILPFGHAEYPGKIDAGFYFLMYDDLYRLLRELTAEEGVEIMFNTRVADIDPDSGTVLLDGGRTVKADVIIGADGMSSMIRSIINDDGFEVEEHGTEQSEDLALGCTIPADRIRSDPELDATLKFGETTYWMGDGYYVAAAYSSSQHYYLNLWTNSISNTGNSILNTGASSHESWHEIRETTTGRLRLRCLEDGADPRLRKLLDMAQNVWTQPIQFTTRARFENAVDESATICLVGDAGHPIMPYSLHSIALGFEDASTLLQLFSGITRRDHIPRLLNAYEEIRQPRWDTVMHTEQILRAEYSMPPGEQRDGRDLFITRFKHIIGSGSESGEDEMQTMVLYTKAISLYDYDVTEQVDDWYSKWEALLNRPSLEVDTTSSLIHTVTPTPSVTALLA